MPLPAILHTQTIKNQWCGNWSSSARYAQASSVLGSDGNYYVSTVACQGVDPTTDSQQNVWTLIPADAAAEGKTSLGVFWDSQTSSAYFNVPGT